VNEFRDRDLPFGEKGESLILELILKKYKTAYKQDGYHKEYDIMIPEINKTVEVKRDAQTDSTGNIFIESSCQNVESGIAATTANIFAYITESKIYWIETENINKCIEEQKILKGVGFRIQGKKIDAYLIPTSIFEKYCIRIDKLTEEHKCQLNSNKAQR
jgi:hypothetical protein